jgi:flagellar protein FliS
MTIADTRSRFLADTVATAGPARLLTMLYDRLLLDLDRGHRALEAGDRGQATGHLNHAQDIVGELVSSLDLSAWDGANGLLQVYTYLLREIIGANMSGSAERVTACRALVAPLHEAWHEAASLLTPASSGVLTGELGVG